MHTKLDIFAESVTIDEKGKSISQDFLSGIVLFFLTPEEPIVVGTKENSSHLFRMGMAQPQWMDRKINRKVVN